MKNLHFNDDLYGPFYLNSRNEKLHWQPKCSKFPSLGHIHSKLCSYVPSESILCPECLELDKKSESSK